LTDETSDSSDVESEGERDPRMRTGSEEEEKELAKKVDPVQWCPNTSNPHHTCVEFCQLHWTEQREEQRKATAAAATAAAVADGGGDGDDDDSDSSDSSDSDTARQKSKQSSRTSQFKPEELGILPVPVEDLPKVNRKLIKLPPAVIDVSHFSTQGRRPTMEDKVQVIESFKINKPPHCVGPLSFFGVYDGHSGTGAVEYCYKAVYEFLKQQLKLGMAPAAALDYAYAAADKHVLADGSGCTACSVLVCKETGRMWVANCGDSRAVLCRAGQAIELTKDHKASDALEAKRIAAAGGEILDVKGNKYVKYPKEDTHLGLSVSRSLGDNHYNDTVDPLIIGTPDITQQVLQKEDEFVVLACDGVWDVMSSQQAVDHLRSFYAKCKKKGRPVDAEKMSEELANKALKDRSGDNISVVVAIL